MNQIIVEVEGGKQISYLTPKKFKTGSTGYYASLKVTTPEGKRFQVNCNVIEIGSKNKPQEQVESSSELEKIVNE